MSERIALRTTPVDKAPAESSAAEKRRITQGDLLVDYAYRRAESIPLPDIRVDRDPETGGMTLSVATQDIALALSKASLAKSCGTSYEPLCKKIVAETVAALRPTEEKAQETVDAVLAALIEVDPRDPLEAMLGAQLFVTHHLIMRRLRGAPGDAQTPQLADYWIGQGVKLMKLFLQQIEALQRYRNRGNPQVVRVEKVVVQDQGQAIVGNVGAKEGRGAV